MNTWISKASLAGFALGLLGGCAGGLSDMGLNLAAAPGGEDTLITQVDLASGAVSLQAPRGYCVDPSSVTRRFALLARCDRLGEAEATFLAPLGLITVSLTRGATADALPDAQTLKEAFDLTSVSDPSAEEDFVILRAEGTPAAEGLSTTHWRAAAQIEGHILGIALYGAPGGAATTSEGRTILDELIRETKAAS